MATTDSRPGFRLPWTADPSVVSDPTTDVDAAAPSIDADGAADAAAETAGPTPAAAVPGVDGSVDRPSAEPVAAEASETPADAGARPEPPSDQRPPSGGLAVPRSQRPAAGRRSSTFLAELARAMHAAALEARARVLDQFRAESKTVVEELHARAAEETAALRRAADEDVAAIRDWSKAEIARIRDETERRIAARKAALEAELEAQAARIEERIERLQAAVGEFEAEMDRFFDRLLAVEDPTEFAALAANLPEPPPFEEILAEPRIVEAADGEDAGAVELDPAAREATFAAIEAAARAAETDEAISAAEAAVDEPAPPTEVWDDLAAERLAAEPVAADAAPDAPEAAASVADDLDSLDDEQIAARLAGLLGPREEPPSPPAEPVRTQVAVIGLASVASIAGFKRQLAHLPGVQSVGVASGPSGEFLFTVTHDPDLDLAAVVPGLPGFGARVTASQPGSLAVTAHDPDLSA